MTAEIVKENPTQDVGNQKGRIPLEVLHPGFNGTVPGTSGKSNLEYKVTENHIKIVDVENSERKFDAGVINGILQVDVANKDSADSTKKHSDISITKAIPNSSVAIKV